LASAKQGMAESSVNGPDGIFPEIGEVDVPISFDAWVGNRELTHLGTNAGAQTLAFQGWRHFKEAFAPELVSRAVSESKIPVNNCLDPFGGSGTTALACQFLGVRPTTIEVNPYLADLIEAKLATYSLGSIASDASRVIEGSRSRDINPEGYLQCGPATLVEPGVGERWIFDAPVAERIFALVEAINELDSETNARLLRALLGGALVELSNVRISGKGRRYRGGWQSRRVSTTDVDQAFLGAITTAVHDITLHNGRSCREYQLIRGDTRSELAACEETDLVIFSPPYPNSFDYTDVYNLELWMLGYLSSGAENLSLRRSTLSSHVQISRTYTLPPEGSSSLDQSLQALEAKRSSLWNRTIPDMVGAYFAELADIMDKLSERLSDGGRIYSIVGDSQYAGVIVPVAAILTELAPEWSMKVVETEASRSMRASAQQGGGKVLPESLLVFEHID
jgi:hypothetical protein